MIPRWLGTVPYAEAHAAQHAAREAILRGEGEEALWGLEHPPVVTTGRRGVEDLDPARIAAAGYALVSTERGGLATVHEPGQLVVYLLVRAHETGVRRLVWAIEEGLVRWIRGQGVEAGRREGYPGVWDGDTKLAAIGLHVKQGVTMHGLALNLVNELRGFDLITPCGIVDGRVGSLRQRVPTAPGPEAAFPGLADELVRVLLDERARTR